MDKRRCSESGFTLLEALIVIVIIAIVAVFGYPALDRMIIRNNLEGAARGVAVVAQTARIEATKRSRDVLVFAESDAEGDRIRAVVDEDGDGTADADEEQIGRVDLHATSDFLTPDSQPATAVLVFQDDGSVAAPGGAIRIGDIKGNFLEIRVAPIATGKVQVRKWDNSGGVNPLEDELPAADAFWFAPGDDGRAWKWFT